jgi:putative methyltransferase (TIGR04325 family)
MLKKIKKYFKKKEFNYTKKFKTYELAQKHLKNLNIYFDKRFTKKFFEPKDVEAIERFYVASIIVALHKKKKLNILDIGGGNNPIFSYIKKSTDISVDCTILETNKFSKIIKKKVPDYLKKCIKYISDIREIKKKIDIVCFISSIQYLNNYKEIIINLKKYGPEYFIITRSFFHTNKSNFYSIEHCVPGTVHPYIFFSFKDLKLFFNQNGYKLIFQNKYNSNIYSHDSFRSNLFYHKDLVFKKK